MFDLGAAPLVGVLGFSARQPRETCHGALLAGVAASGALTLPLLVGAWGAPLDGIWSAVARESARLASAWVLCFNGRALRLCDGRNTFARGHLEFDLEALADHPAAMAPLLGHYARRGARHNHAVHRQRIGKAWGGRVGVAAERRS